MRLQSRRLINQIVVITLTITAFVWIWHNTKDTSGQSPVLKDGHIRPQEVPGSLVSSKSQRSIAKVMSFYGDSHDGMYDRTVKGHIQHANLHGYQMLILREKIMPKLWSKMAYILSILLRELEKPSHERLQWLFWVDADIVMLNDQIPLDIFLPPADFLDIDLLVTKDDNGLNSGAFFARVTETMVQMCIDVIALPRYRPEVKLKYNDQSAMEYVLSDPLYINRTMFVPQRWFNAYRGPRDDKEEIKKGAKVPASTVRPGDLQIHFAGKGFGKGTVKEKMPFWIDRSENAEWTMPLEDTTYLEEISRYWKARRKYLGS